VEHGEADRRVVVLDQHQVGLLADLDAADGRVEAECPGAAAGAVVDDVLGPQDVAGEDDVVTESMVLLTLSN
jgi:hypothetical protein